MAASNRPRNKSALSADLVSLLPHFVAAVGTLMHVKSFDCVSSVAALIAGHPDHPFVYRYVCVLVMGSAGRLL